MDTIIIISRIPRRAIEIGRALANLGINLVAVKSAQDLSVNVPWRNSLAIVAEDSEHCSELTKFMTHDSATETPILPFDAPNRLRRRVLTLTLRRNCDRLLIQYPGVVGLGVDFWVDVQKQIIIDSRAKSIPLTRAETAILVLLANSHRKTVFKDDILHRLWGRSDKGACRTLDVHISVLRTKLSHHHFNLEIRSIRQFGYTLAAVSRDIHSSSSLPIVHSQSLSAQ